MKATEDTTALVLAAGKGTRMKADLPKVLFPAGGRPLIHHVLDAVDAAGFGRRIVVVGHQAERVEAEIAGRGAEFALQAEQLGTGHAVMVAEPLLRGHVGDVAVLAGDVPLIRPETLRGLMARHRGSGAAVTVLTAILPDPSGYGRIVRGEDDRVTAIVEHRDCTPGQLSIREINSSIYAFRIPFLLEALPEIDNRNDQGEYYLTDTVSLACARGLPVEGVVVEDLHELSGVNTPDQLAEVEAALEARRGG